MATKNSTETRTYSAWLWPDHAIGKRESRTLREEHNALLNAYQARTPEKKTHNGWTNYETWCVHLWLSKEEGTYNACREIAADCERAAPDHANTQGPRPIWTVEQAARFTTADALKAFVEESAPELPPSMFSDLMNAALSEVNWSEIADAFLEK